MSGYCYECDAVALKLSERSYWQCEMMDDETIMMLMHTGHKHAEGDDFEQV